MGEHRPTAESGKVAWDNLGQIGSTDPTRAKKEPIMDLTPYTGLGADHGDPKVSAVALENSTYSQAIYRPGSVDHVFFDQAVALQPATVDRLYSDFTPLDQPFMPGTRPFLEKLTAKVTGRLGADRDKAIALMEWTWRIRVNYSHPEYEPFHGGSEEEVVRKGSDMCNEMARVMIVMAQIAGIPSRYVGHMTPLDHDSPSTGTGHGVCELHVDGAWAYFDVRGRCFEKANGSLASAWGVISAPGLLDRQSEAIKAHMDFRSSTEGAKSLYAPGVAHIIVNYLAADHANYDYSWSYPSKSLWLEAREKARHLRTTRHKDVLPQPAARA